MVRARDGACSLIRDDEKAVGVATACLDALLAHERAEARVGFLLMEGASDAELAEASNAATAAFEAYRLAAARWHLVAISNARQPELSL
jgi:hypothetical protein